MSRHNDVRVHRHDRNDGWMLLLPVGMGGHVVCLDDDGQSLSALKTLVQHVTVVCVTEARAAAVAASIGTRSQLGIEVTTVDRFLGADGGGPVAGLVLNLLAAAEPLPLFRLRLLARQCVRRMGPDSFVYVAAANRSGYTRLRREGAGSDAGLYLTRGQARSLLRAAGVRKRVRAHLLLSERGAVQEVLSPRGYRSPDEGGGFERARELMLNRHTARWLAPAFALVGHLGQPRRSLLDELALRVLPVSGARACLRRYLVLDGKIIVDFQVGDDLAGRIVVLARDERCRQRRRHEFEVLTRLQGVSTLADKIPRAVATGEIGGHGYSVIGKLPGAVVGGAVRDLKVITERAAEFLVLLGGHGPTASLHDPSLHRHRFGTLINAAVARYPIAERSLRRIDLLLAGALQGQVIPWVIEHGDFKIENVIIDRRTRRVNGVIDWELAQQDGLPLIDPLYLLVYNRRLADGYSFDQACRELVLAGAWDQHEQRLLGRYRAAVAISDEVFTALRLFFPIHAIARRLRYDMDHPGQRRALMELVHAVERACEELIGTGARQPLTGTEG